MKPGSVSPSKGKAQEPTHWHSGWWDFYPLTERPHRPLQWSQSSVIFSAHPTQPLVTARHFSSSKQFALPSPKPITSTSNVYEPPAIISVAPSDDWLFAYFPKTSGEGTGCLWKRGPQVDNWAVQEWWTFPPQTAPIAASWLGAPREWAINGSGLPGRLPPRGFALPTSGPTLILVTQDYRVHICYYQFYLQNLQILKCPLGMINVLRVNQPIPDEDPPDLVKLCVDATIGVSYNGEFPIFVAARLRQFTASTTQNAPFDPMDLTVPTVAPNDDKKQDEWDSRNDDCVIEVNQVFLRYHGVSMAILINPLAPIPVNTSGVYKMDFLSCPIIMPPTDTAGSASPAKRPIVDKGKLYLALSYLDFEGYVSAPKSQLSVFSINRRPSLSGNPTFAPQLEATRIFTSGVLTHIASSAPHLRESLLPVVVLDVSGQWSNTAPKKPKDIAVGKVHILNLPDLKDREDWEPTTVKVPFDSAGRDLPLQAISSPNGVLLNTTSLSSPQPRIGIHLLPVQRYSGEPPLVRPLVLSILSRKSPSDVCHYLSLPSIPLDEVVKTLTGAMTVLDANANGLRYASIWDILGIAVEVYRKRAGLAKDEGSRECYKTKWQTMHDMCSVAACNRVFGNCADGDTYDLDAVWQLTGLSNWIITLIERIMKECVIFCDATPKDKMEEPPDDLFGPIPDESNGSEPGISPTLLHLVHPFALQNLLVAVKHVKKYHHYIESLPAGAENAQIAKDFLVDLVDCSGVNLRDLEAVFEASISGVNALPPEDCRMALASCQPTQPLRDQLTFIIKNVTDSPTALNKATLFIKPRDLVEGVVNLNIGTQNKHQDEDVVTKGVVMIQEPHLKCSRCGGLSNTVFDIQSPKLESDQWRTWEKMWTFRCICGGAWIGES